MASTPKSFFQTLKRYVKAPWNYTGPQSGPEYKSSVPLATEYRPYCPATIRERAVVPSSDPETVYDIKYYVRDPRNRPPLKRTVVRKGGWEKVINEIELQTDSREPVVKTVVDLDYSQREGDGGYVKGRDLTTEYKKKTNYIWPGGL